nr:hypothetical protein [Tanacetum cinerariifolium]
MEVAGKDGEKKKEKKNKGLLRASKINNIEGKAVGKDGNPLQRDVRGVHGVNDNDKGYSNEKINIGTGFNKNNESVNDTSVSNPMTLTSTNDALTNTSHAHDVIRPEMVNPSVNLGDFYEVSSSDGTKENGNPNVTSRVSTDKNMLVNGEHVNMENGLVALVNEVLEQGPWLIRNIPLILTKWTPNLTLSKEKTQHNIGDPSTIVTKEAEKVQTDESDSETSSASYCSKGCRIILGWNTNVVNVVLIAYTDQAMDIKIFHKAKNTIIYGSIIYASNCNIERRQLWDNLNLHKRVTRGNPWILMGDFNVALNLKDSLSCLSRFNSAMNDFKECVNKIEILDIKSSGLHFTWNQKPKNRSGLLKKLNRIMCNLDFVDCF